MKTQIILRTVLVVVALFISFYNNGTSMQSTIQSNPSNSHTGGFLKKLNRQEEINSASSNCIVCSERTYPQFPETDGEHEFHPFHFTHNEKRGAFWKKVANKVLAVIYYIVILVAYIPFKFFN